MNKNKIFILLLILLSIILFTFKLGSYSLWDNDEPLYTQMAREFNNHSDFLTLTWNGKPWFCHPPLYMWTSFIIGNIFGWGEFSARLPSVIFSVLIILLTYFIARKFYNENTAFIGALILMTSLQFFIQARLANLDTTFTFFMMAAVYIGYIVIGSVRQTESSVQNVFKSRRLYVLLFWIMCALGTLTKGPFALCLPFAIIIIYLFFTKKLKELKVFFTIEGILLYLIVGGFWYAAGLLKYKMEFYNLVFKYFTFERVISPVMDQSGPIYYYLLVFIPGLFPWIAFFVPAVSDAFKNIKDERNIFFIVWIMFTFIFFTLVQTKLPNYILFIYPACAIMLADYFYRNICENNFKNKLFLPLLFTSIFYAAVIAVFVLLVEKRYPLEYIENKANLLILFYIIVITLILIWGSLIFNRKKYILSVFIAGTFILYIFMINLTVSVDKYKPVKPLALKVKEMKNPSDKIAVFIKKFSGASSFVFYINEKIEFIENIQDLEAFLRKNKDTYVLIKKDNSAQIKDRFALKHAFDYDKYSVYRN